ncbi:hypothetical protein BK809_0004497 [Diplodia seriata]|uniref:Integral membrane protein n=1 Tax=Diplodia seriata TaxID=420778 RepID=A0A1S8B6U5_9PEZI|nr:hypothetical protein BK809_0004497 [Diplodia seriata]
MTGTLVPPGWRFYEVTPAELAVVSLVWGFSLGWSIFAAGTALRQTLQMRRRRKHLTVYIAMVWAELVASFIIGFFGWFFMMGMIPPSFWFFFFVLVFWVIQIQVILQIIVNRVGLLVPDKRHVRKMKWCVAAYVGVINVSVFCIWLPAQLQRSATYVRLNRIWDPVTKGLFLLLDGSLNLYFLRMVRRDLIAMGLHKYTTLFWTNAAMAVVSVFMDVAIILSMLFKNPFVYVQFHPLAYLIKLSIEMALADLIAKLVRAAASASHHDAEINVGDNINAFGTSSADSTLLLTIGNPNSASFSSASASADKKRKNGTGNTTTTVKSTNVDDDGSGRRGGRQQQLGLELELEHVSAAAGSRRQDVGRAGGGGGAAVASPDDDGIVAVDVADEAGAGGRAAAADVEGALDGKDGKRGRKFVEFVGVSGSDG